MKDLLLPGMADIVIEIGTVADPLGYLFEMDMFGDGDGSIILFAEFLTKSRVSIGRRFAKVVIFPCETNSVSWNGNDSCAVRWDEFRGRLKSHLDDLPKL